VQPGMINLTGHAIEANYLTLNTAGGSSRMRSNLDPFTSSSFPVQANARLMLLLFPLELLSALIGSPWRHKPGLHCRSY
jgi:hypothetical protein